MGHDERRARSKLCGFKNDPHASIAARQQAKWAIPATAEMAVAPLVYTLWNRGSMRLRSEGSDLAGSRPLRAVERPCSMLLCWWSCILTAPRGGETGRLRKHFLGKAVGFTLDDPSATFRQTREPRAPGHLGIIKGLVFGGLVETTTGPLGQGIATSVGHGRWARKKKSGLPAATSRPGFEIFD